VRTQANNANAVSGAWSSVALMDTNVSVSAGAHQYSATADAASLHAAAGIMYISPGTPLFEGTIGAEWDYVKKEEPSTPKNMVMLSRQALQVTAQRANYYGNSYAGSGTFFYGLSLYKADSGALVFNAGSWQYQWGISRMRGGAFNTNAAVDVAMQQALVNLLKDFGHGPTTLLSAVANDTLPALVDPGAAMTPADYGLDAPLPVVYETIFTPDTTPQSASSFDGNDINVGTLFSTDAAGSVHGARWYFPDSLPDHPVTATLYSWTDDTTGTPLASVTFSNCQQGWNEALFTAPVAISAGNRYVIAVWSSDYYVATAGMFSSADVTNSHLTAPQDSAGAHNGKYVSGNGAPAYPTATTGSFGYLADVLFESGGTLTFEGWGIPIN